MTDDDLPLPTFKRLRRLLIEFDISWSSININDMATLTNQLTNAIITLPDGFTIDGVILTAKDFTIHWHCCNKQYIGLMFDEVSWISYPLPHMFLYIPSLKLFSELS